MEWMERSSLHDHLKRGWLWQILDLSNMIWKTDRISNSFMWETLHVVTPVDSFHRSKSDGMLLLWRLFHSGERSALPMG